MSRSRIVVRVDGVRTRPASRAGRGQYEKVGQVAFDAYTGGDLDGLRRFIAANDDQP